HAQCPRRRKPHRHADRLRAEMADLSFLARDRPDRHVRLRGQGRSAGRCAARLPDGKHVAFIGRPLETGADPGSHLYLLEVRSGAARRLLPDALDKKMIGFVDIDVRCPLAFSADGRWLIFVLPSGDLRHVLRIPVDGGAANPEILFATTTTPNYLDSG